MDIVTDLTSQAVSSLIIIQDLWKKDLGPTDRNKMENVFLWELKEKLAGLKEKCSPEIEGAINDVIWFSPEKLAESDLIECFFVLSNDLLKWMDENHLPVVNPENDNLSKDGTLFCSPFQLRRMIRAILYHNPAARVTLAKALHYMPVQVIFCLSGKKLKACDQRLYQVWEPEQSFDLLDADDKKLHETWWNAHYKSEDKKRKTEALELLISDSLMRQTLKIEEVPVPFETLFNDELNEICRSRAHRLQDNPAGVGGRLTEKVLSDDKTEDPIERAKRLQLQGLAFSGGGIRSATFCLGILQKLAEQNKLSHIDYLSTVSGGGYIGTWLASWIKRSGSVLKVTDRLDSRKSADPMGEEVRPIRWLRMFSNYLAPDANIMSADSWTMGVTWLRNTLINQFIFLLLLCTALSGVNNFFLLWRYITHFENTFNSIKVGGWSALIFLPGVIMTGYGMQAFDKQHKERSYFNFGRNRLLSIFLIIWAVIAAFAVSSWLFQENPYSDEYQDKVLLLIPAAAAGFAAMIAIAYIGYYRQCAQRPIEKKYIDFAILGSSALAATAGLFLLAGVWELFQSIKSPFISDQEYGYRWVFISGPPLILESISCCVVIRMALMGRLFPDERREWWGRMGAIIHRFILIWLLVTIGALILPDVFRELCRNTKLISKIPVLFGGWAAIIGAAVKLAYQSKDAGPKTDDKASIFIEIFIRIAPYLFMLGFLLIGAYTLDQINLIIVGDKENFIDWTQKSLLVTVVLAALTLFLSWRVGVNEFSLHHFYRNRLVRAYLGATRKRTDRDKTANNFTGFDKDDDIKLSAFVCNIEKDPYYGPYPLINTTLNSTVVSELDRQDRKAESFIFTPLYSGFDFSPTRSAAYAKNQVYEYGYRPTAGYAYENGPMIGTAMAISGAAVNPNMGYHSSPATAFLLTMFNVRLGWWIGNPRLKTWKRSDPTFGVAYLVSDLIGKSDISSRFVCLSDGGHFDNMGLYELVRRRCTNVILCDAEEDKKSTCEGLSNAIRRCRIDFGVEITITTDTITDKDAQGFSKSHAILDGAIKYPGDKDDAPSGKITYIKTSLTKNLSTDIREYHLNNPLFPQQPTSDQFFTEEQFESYRKLGYESI
ncbi:patatin-like phospholipase family protein [uncultured Mucilaginibacter sp.]|uniref:patatin-like phospholipase family protein n=1 Tax=uncultured Mucilaginibacter sp. TaxID=797541 RepID=UPI0025D5510D|nr:patatin-like phospholipase family protein [uncultured Mucilaginibacter sp.]